MPGTLIGVGVGPGDPDHLTLGAVAALGRADRVFVPVTEAAGEVGRAERVVAPHVPAERIVRLTFAMRDPALRETNWDRAGAAIAEDLAGGGTAAFCTLGDPNVYSTFAYVRQTVVGLVPDVTVETICGITAMQDLAARTGTVLTEGNEVLTLLPMSAGEEALAGALAGGGTVVVYKGGGRAERVRALVADAGRTAVAVYGEHLGMADEHVRDGTGADGAGPARGPYLSTVLVPAARTAGARGGRLTDEHGRRL